MISYAQTFEDVMLGMIRAPAIRRSISSENMLIGNFRRQGEAAFTGSPRPAGKLPGSAEYRL
jgi:hypothetical protein